MKIMPKHAGTAAPAVARPREMTTNQPSRCSRDGNILFDGQLPDSAATIPSALYLLLRWHGEDGKMPTRARAILSMGKYFLHPGVSVRLRISLQIKIFSGCAIRRLPADGEVQCRPRSSTWPEIQFAYPRDFGFIEGHSS
jgi:hypothetical protein